MITVNPAFLSDILSPLTGGADMDDMAHLELIDSNNETEVKVLIQEYFLPYFLGRSNTYKENLKCSLEYFLSSNTIDYGRVIESCLLPIYTPDNPRNLFVWIWEVIWRNESYQVADLGQYREQEDIHRPTRL